MTSLVEDIVDPMSATGYRVVHRFGHGIPDGCSVPLSLKSEEERRCEELLRKGSISKEEAEEIRRRYGQWSRRSVIAGWIYQETENQDNPTTKSPKQKSKEHHHHHHYNYKSLLHTVRRSLHLHNKKFKPKVPPELLEVHHEMKDDRETCSLAASTGSTTSSHSTGFI